MSTYTKKATARPGSSAATSEFTFTQKSWDSSNEFERFENLAKKLVRAPKAEASKKPKRR